MAVPMVLSPDQWQALIKAHGGVRFYSAGGASSGGNPLLGGQEATQSIAVFGDGYRLMFHDDRSQGSASIVVDDPGNVPELQPQSSQKSTITEVSPGATLYDTAQGKALYTAPTAQQQQQEQAPGAMQSAFEDLDATIEYIRGQMASGRITAQEANRLMGQARSALSDKLTGSSGFDRAKAAADYRQNNAQMGASMLNQRVGSGTSMANGLVDYMAGAAQHMLPGDGFDPSTWNPWALAKSFVTDLGGGQATYDTAQQMVQGATGQAPTDSMDPASPAYWYGSPQDPGDGGIPDSFDMGPDQQMPAWYPQGAPPSVPYGPGYGASQSGYGGGY